VSWCCSIWAHSFNRSSICRKWENHLYATCDIKQKCYNRNSSL